MSQGGDLPRRPTDALNLIWLSFFLVSAVFALARAAMGQPEVFNQIMQATFDMAKVAFEIALFLTGVLALWLGIMRIGEKGGAVEFLTRFLKPLFRKLMPEVPSDHPALGSIVMNMAANMMGLDNAATPIGLKAMGELQTLNPEKDRASNAQILFLVINTSSVTLLPVTIFAYRAQQGAAQSTDVFIPILLATYISTLTGLLAVSVVQRINLFNRVVMSYLGGFTAVVAGILLYFSSLSQAAMESQSAFLSNLILFGLVISFLIAATWKRVNVYETFVEGAKEGFSIAIRIVPYLVAMLVAIGVFRASGAMGMFIEAIRSLVAGLGLDTSFVEALPTAFMKPLSGSGARAMMVEAMQTHGADSFVGRLVSIIQGSTETTFYVLAVYFGSVGIRRTRHAVTCGLLADLAGVVAAIALTYFFFGAQT